MAPRSKRQKRASAEKSNRDESAAAPRSSSSPQTLSLESFFTLPHELQLRIIELACRSPPRPPPPIRYWEREDDTSKVPPLLDTGTALGLQLAFKAFFGLTTRILYRNVMLDRPSALVSFHQAVTSHAQLGELVHSLHAGPVLGLPHKWNPLFEREGYYASDWSDEDRLTPPYHPPCMQIRNSLSRSEMPALEMPSSMSDGWATWGVAGDVMSLNERETWHGCDEVFDAVELAQRVIDVDLQDNGYAYDGRTKLAKVEYTQRVFEVQAVMDLCYYEIERRQAKYGRNHPFEASKGQGVPCLPLVLTGYPTTPGKDKAMAKNAKAEDPFILDRADLLYQIARPGSATDRFDSPLLFARSGIDVVKTNSTVNDRRRKLVDTNMYGEGKDWADIFSPSTGFLNASASRPLESIDVSLPQVATIGSLLAKLRTVLLATPNVENLSLTGFLERAICGTRSVAPLLLNLRSLGLGPPPQLWLAPMLFDKLDQVRQLRICGVELLEEEAASIASQLSRLERLQWSLPGQLTRAYAEKLPAMIDILVGRSNAASVAAFPAVPEEFSSTKMEEDVIDSGSTSSSSSTSTTSPTRPVPLIELKLHGTDLNTLLATAPTPAIKAAWQTGSVLPGQARRLLLVKSKAPANGRWWRSVAYGGLCVESREWWDQQGGIVRLPVVKAEVIW